MKKLVFCLRNFQWSYKSARAEWEAYKSLCESKDGPKPVIIYLGHQQERFWLLLFIFILHWYKQIF